MFERSAAGFIATSVVGLSPGVSADASERAGGCPDLGREIGQGGEIVPERGGRVGEPTPRQLHPVAGVTGEPDDYPLALLDARHLH
jgi:hypothetical protein